jgi:hypothetical protein
MMTNPNSDTVAAYLALKAANDQLRERGKQWLWNALDRLSSELSRELSGRAGGAPLQTGRQDWEFRLEGLTLAGERYGARYAYRTLIVEAGWPRTPEHGFIPDGGLARGRISLSRNTMLDAQPIAELVLTRLGAGDPAWFSFAHKPIGPPINDSHLLAWLKLLLAD